MTPRDPDPALRRFELDAIVACVLLAVGALAVTRGRLDAFFGVLGGGLLMALSYRAVKGGVTMLVDAAAAAGRERGGEAGPDAAATGRDGPAAEPGGDDESPRGQEAAGPGSGDRRLRARRLLLAVKFFTRYALLALAAYVMLTCFRLHPVGVLVGAMSPFFAAVVLVGRLSRARSGPRSR